MPAAPRKALGRAGGGRVRSAALGCALLLGCGSSYYAQYRAEHLSVGRVEEAREALRDQLVAGLEAADRDRAP